MDCFFVRVALVNSHTRAQSADGHYVCPPSATPRNILFLFLLFLPADLCADLSSHQINHGNRSATHHNHLHHWNASHQRSHVVPAGGHRQSTDAHSSSRKSTSKPATAKPAITKPAAAKPAAAKPANNTKATTTTRQDKIVQFWRSRSTIYDRPMPRDPGNLDFMYSDGA